MLTKAVITAAGKGTRQYPATNTVQKELFPLVDMDGITKPTIQIIAEQALEAGIEEIAIVVQPGEEKNFALHFQALENESKNPGLHQQSNILAKLNNRITYIPQPSQEGYGHAVYCAREWVGDSPFLLLLGDHIYISSGSRSCISQVVDIFNRYQTSIFAVKETPEEQLHLYGVVGGTKFNKTPPLFKLENIMEKPDIRTAQKYLSSKALPPGKYLSFFGIYVFTPSIFTVLEEFIENNIREKGEIQLTNAQAVLCERESAIGALISGKSLDMGTPLGYLETQFTLAMNSIFADQIKQKVLQILQ